MSIYDNDQNEFSTYSCGNRVPLIGRGLRSKLGGAAPEKKNRATSSQHLLIEMLHTCASVGTMQIVEKLILRTSLCQDPPEYDDIPERPVQQ